MFGDRVFDFDIPRRAVRREVAGNVSAEDERQLAALGAVCDVSEAARAINDLAVRAIGRHHLFRVAIEGIDRQRHTIIEQAVAAANHCVGVVERGDGDACARRDANRFGDPLPVEARAEVNREPRVGDPVILREEACLKVRAVEDLAAADELCATDESPARINDVDGPRLEVAAIGRARDARSELQIVRAHRLDRRKRISLDGLDARGMTVLIAEVIAAVALRRERHLVLPLSPDAAVVALDGQR